MPRTPLRKISQPPETPHTPAQFLATTVTIPELDARISASRPFPSRSSLKSSKSETHGNGTIPNLCDSSDEEDPTIGYVRLKLQLDHMLANRAEFPHARIEEMRARLDKCGSDFLFIEHEAESIYQKEQRKALLERLRGSGSPSLSPALGQRGLEKTSTNAQNLPLSILSSSSSSDVFDDVHSDGSEGGLFGLLEGLPATEMTNDSVIITLREMALPKHWPGPTPKILLKETVLRLDRYAVITYNLISGSSRIKRVSLTIRWDGTKSDIWAMNDVACPDQIQAEHYIALTVLHALTFPRSEGFASSFSGSNGPTFFRLLPPSFRDLWDELEDARKLQEHSTNRQVWAKLRSIIEPKIDPNKKVCKLFVRSYSRRQTSSARLLGNNQKARLTRKSFLRHLVNHGIQRLHPSSSLLSIGHCGIVLITKKCLSVITI